MNTNLPTFERERNFQNKQPRRLKLWRLAALVALGCGVSTSARANDTTWNTAGSGVWSNAANWTNAIPANANTTIVRFGGTTSYTATQDITSATLVNQFVFTNTGVGQTVTISGGATANRGVQFSGTTPIFTFGGTANLTFDANANIRFNADTTLSGSGTGVLTIAALGVSGAASRTFTINLSNLATPVNISTLSINNNATGNWTLTLATTSNATVGTITNGGTPTGSFIKANGGNLTILNAGSYTGTTVLNNGTTFISGFDAFGTTPTTPIGLGHPAMNNVAILSYSGPSTSYTRGFTLGQAGGRIDVTNAAANVTIDTGAITPTNATSSFSKGGGGTLTLNTANTYSGTTNVLAGTLALGPTGNFGTSNVFNITSGGVLNVGTSTLNISSGGSLSAGRTTGFAPDIVGDASLTGATINVASSTAYGTITQTGNLALNGGTLQWNLNNVNTVGAGINDLIDITGNLTLDGTIAVNVSALNGALTSGSYRLFNYTGTLTGGAANLAQPIVNAPGRNTYVYDTSTLGQVNLNVTAAPSGTLTWVGGVNTNAWDLQNTINWTGEADNKFYTGDTVNFTDAGLANNTVDIVGALQPFTINVSNTTGNYIFGSTSSGSIIGPAAVTKTGAGTLTIQTANTYSGATTINEGTVIAANPAALGDSTGATIVASGAQIQFTGGGTFAEPITLNGTGIANAGALQSTSGATIIAGTVTLTGATSITNNDLTNTLVFDVATGNAFGGTGIIPLTVFGAGNIDINDPIGTGATGGVIKNGTGTLTLGGAAANGTTGGYIVNGGMLLLNKTTGIDATRGNVTIGNGTDPATVKLAAANLIRDTTGDTVTINTNGLLDLDGNSETVDTLLGTGTVTGSAGTFTISSGNFAGLLTGAMAVTKSDEATLSLTGTVNTFTGKLRINNGILEVNTLADSGPGSNGVGIIEMLNTTNESATLRYLGSGTTITRPISVTANGSTAGNAVIESSGTGPLIIDADVSRLNTGSGQKTFVLSGTNTGLNSLTGGIINGAATLNVAKDGVGTWRLAGTNSYLGNTSVLAGRLLIDGDSTGATGAVNVSAAATLGGSGTVGGLTTLSNTSILAPGTTIGNLTFATGVNLSAGGVYQWQLGTLSTDGTTPGLNFDAITVSGGNLTLGGTSALTLDFGLVAATGPNSADAFWTTSKTWKIVDITGTGSNSLNESLSTITNATYSSGTFTTSVGIDADAGDIFLVFTPGVVVGPSIWTGNGVDNNWTAANSWTGSVPNGISAEAKFVSTGETTANLDASQTVNKLTFDSTAPHTISGPGTLSLAGTTPSISTAGSSTGTETVAVNLNLGTGTTITVNAGTLNLNSPTNAVLGTGVTATVVTGATLSLGGAGNALSNGSTTHVAVANNGTLAATTAGKRVGAISGTGSTNVTAAGASLTASSIRQSSLAIGSTSQVTLAPSLGNKPAGISVFTSTTGNSLAIAAGGVLDTNDNDLIVYYASGQGAATLAAMQQQILDGFTSTPGVARISSSTAAIDGDKFLVTLDNNVFGLTTWEGVTLTGTEQIIAKYTLFGDLNFDNVVDSFDYSVIDSNFGSGNSWLSGDANLDGVVDSFDYSVIDTNFGKSFPALGLGVQGASQGVAAVPEPSAFVLAGVALLGFGGWKLRCRRRAA